MKRPNQILLGVALAALVGAAAIFGASVRGRTGRDGPAVATKIREVSRLVALEVNAYKKISFAPDPEAKESLWGKVAQWARYSLNAPKGRAIVFAKLEYSYDLSRVTQDQLRVVGTTVELALPAPVVSVALRPEETEVIGSNLDSAQTAQLFALAQEAFLREAEQDEALLRRARASAEQTLRLLMLTLGYREVRFVDRISAPGPS